jgi:hypothetical protein
MATPAGFAILRVLRKSSGPVGVGRLRALPSGNGLRQSGIVFFFSTRDAALEGPLFHGDVGGGLSQPFAKACHETGHKKRERMVHPAFPERASAGSLRF